MTPNEEGLSNLVVVISVGGEEVDLSVKVERVGAILEHRGIIARAEIGTGALLKTETRVPQFLLRTKPRRRMTAYMTSPIHR
jgi:hypothetical protein